METQEQKTFQEEYRKIKTIGEGQSLAHSLKTDELIKYRDALQIVNDTFGITMKDEFFLRQIKFALEQRARMTDKKNRD